MKVVFSAFHCKAAHERVQERAKEGQVVPRSMDIPRAGARRPQVRHEGASLSAPRGEHDWYRCRLSSTLPSPERVGGTRAWCVKGRLRNKYPKVGRSARLRMVRAKLPEPKLCILATVSCRHGTIGHAGRSPADFWATRRRYHAPATWNDQGTQRNGHLHADRQRSEIMGSPPQRELYGDRGLVVLK